jgi:putative membrane protein
MLGWLLYLATVGFLLISGIAPHDRFTWCLETCWVWVGLVLVAVLWRRGTQLTTSLKIALCLHAAVLIWGGWYTYERVPLGEWMKVAFGFTRNHYDRIGHFAQGLFPAVLAREVLFRNRVTPSRWWREAFVFSICMAFTGIFEIVEYLTAVAFGSASDAFLGSQGDVWDAQNDMILCGIGTIVSLLVWGPFHLRELVRRDQPAAT